MQMLWYNRYALNRKIRDSNIPLITVILNIETAVMNKSKKTKQNY